MTKPLLVTLGAILVFIGTSLFIDSDTMNEILSVAVVFAAGWGLVRWGGASVRAFLRGGSTVEEQGVIGVVLLLSSIIASRVYTSIYLWLGRPPAWQTLHISAFITYATLGSLILFISATRYAGERPTRLGGIAATVIAFLAVLVSPLWPILIAKLGALLSVLLRVV